MGGVFFYGLESRCAFAFEDPDTGVLCRNAGGMQFSGKRGGTNNFFPAAAYRNRPIHPHTTTA
jgi:hypothetical protein